MLRSLKSKMLALALVSLGGMLSIGVWSAISERSAAYHQRMSMLKSLVESMRTQVGYFEQLEKDGKLSRPDAQAQAKAAVRNVRYQGKEYFYIYNFDGHNVLLPPNPKREGTQMIEEKDKKGFGFVAELIRLAQGGGGYMDYYFPRLGGTEPLRKISYTAGIAGWNWAIGTGLYVDDIEAAFRADLAVTLTVVLILAGGVFVLVLGIGRSVLRQVGGEPSVAVGIMHRVSAGDLRVSVACAPAGSLLGELAALVAQLREVMSAISRDAASLSSASHAISETAQGVADSAHTQSDSTQSMASAMEELTVSISHISESAVETERHARDAAEMALQGRSEVQAATAELQSLAATVGEAVQRIAKLSQQATQVNAIAGSINEIASQTNLLALNAAIEAARAGEQGRGFAVVADEVRKLAERTATATVEIGQTVSAIQAETAGAVGAMDAAVRQVDKGVRLSQNSADLLQRISVGAEQANALVGDVAGATREQGNASTIIATQVEQIARMVESTSAGMRETTQSIQALERVADNLNAVVSRFQC